MEKTELAKLIIDDTQPLRAMINYLNETYNDIKGVELFDVTFTHKEQFVNFISNVVCDELMIIEQNG